MGLDGMDDQQLRDVIVEAQRMLDARSALVGAERAVRDAVAAYAGVAGVSVAEAWRALAPEGVEPPPEQEPVTAPEFVQPTGAHNAYSVGDRVTYKGAVYESTLGGNSWSPAAYPQGWRKL